MANKKVSQLVEHTTLTDNDTMYVVSGIVSKKVRVGTVKSYVTGAVDFAPIQASIATQVATLNNRITNDIAGVNASKQATLTAGANITISPTNVISATGGGSVDLAPLESRVTALEGGKQNTLVAGSNITIIGNTISASSGGGGSSLPEPIIIPCGYFTQAFPTSPTLVGHQMYIGNIAFNRANMRVTLAEPLDISSTDIIYIDIEVINTLTGASVEVIPGVELPGFFRYHEVQNYAFSTMIFPGMHSFRVTAYASSAGTIARGLNVYFDGMNTI
jgi:hypothetical protein